MNDLEYKQLWEQAKNYLALKYDYSKLTFAEKLSLLLSRVLIVAVLLLGSIIVLVCLTGALVDVLTSALGNAWSAYLIVSIIWIALVLLFIALKNVLVVNPVTRFVTKLFFTPEQKDKQI